TTNSRSCVACPLGTYSFTNGSSSCYNCPKRFYSASSGQRSCDECPKPTFTSSVGATSQSDCKIQTCSDWRKVSDVNGDHYLNDLNAGKKFWLAQDYCQSLK